VKVSLISLGCPKNLVDSEIILGNLVKDKFQITTDWKKSDVVVINTCAFLHSAVSEAEQWIKKALAYKKANRIKKVIVAGCLPQRYKSVILDKFPEIDGIIGIDNITDISEMCGNKRTKVNIKQKPNYLHNYHTPRLLSTNHYAYLKIADGCDNFCSYCLIPSIRGRFRSRKIDDIIKEAKQLIKCGVKELILVAQDTTLYGKDIYRKPTLARLLKNIVKIKEIEWIRILYTHPAHWTDELIKVYQENPKICRYIDLPLQHISDKMLKLMNRPYDRADVEKLIGKIKEIPDLAIRTSFIVGFPGEKDKDFEELLDFIKDQKFAHLGCFKYSREPGTVAYNLPNQIPEKIKRERYNKIMANQQKVSLKRMQGFIGKKVKVIIDGKSSLSVFLRRMQKGLNYVGRTEYDAPEIDGVVYISYPVALVRSKTTVNSIQGLAVGDFVEVKIINAQPYALISNP
jgi:ribosomal protein S12 methylthiotransferase